MEMILFYNVISTIDLGCAKSWSIKEMASLSSVLTPFVLGVILCVSHSPTCNSSPDNHLHLPLLLNDWSTLPSLPICCSSLSGNSSDQILLVTRVFGYSDSRTLYLFFVCSSPTLSPDPAHLSHHVSNLTVDFFLFYFEWCKGAGTIAA